MQNKIHDGIVLPIDTATSLFSEAKSVQRSKNEQVNAKHEVIQ